MNEQEELIKLLTNKAQLVAMLAPSFPIAYEYPEIVGKLKRLGFSYVMEVAVGAKSTNDQVIEKLRKNPEAQIITSPCPSFVRLIRKKYPDLLKSLALEVDSPMSATAKFVRKRFPEYKSVFIGPCIAKKFEAAEDHPDLEILVLTYKEINKVFDYFKIVDEESDKQATFDVEQPLTRLYPISGGLAQSSQASQLLAEDELEVVSGWENCQQALKRFQENKNIKLLDILFCNGGCVSGPGIESDLSLEERRKKVIAFWEGEKLKKE